MVFEEPVVPLAMPSVFSVLAVLCHRICVTGRNCLEQGVEAIRALSSARVTLDRLAMLIFDIVRQVTSNNVASTV